MKYFHLELLKNPFIKHFIHSTLKNGYFFGQKNGLSWNLNLARCLLVVYFIGHIQ